MKSKYKPYLVAGAICAWAIVLVFALMTNPSLNDAKRKLAIMKEEMAALLEQGGVVIDAEENAKYGSALLTRVISDEGWSNALLKRYQDALVARGWKRTPDKSLLYCKDGILMKLEPSSRVVRGIGANYIGMSYDGSTIKKCG